MSELQIFKNAEFGFVRTITVEGEPYFVAKDVAGILGYAMDEVLANPDILINALLELKAERERNANLEAMVAIPFAPHLLMPQYMDEGTERELALRMGIIFLSKCEQLWMFGERISNGMAYEIKKAVSMGKKVCYFTADCREVES